VSPSSRPSGSGGSSSDSGPGAGEGRGAGGTSSAVLAVSVSMSAIVLALAVFATRRYFARRARKNAASALFDSETEKTDTNGLKRGSTLSGFSADVDIYADTMKATSALSLDAFDANNSVSNMHTATLQTAMHCKEVDSNPNLTNKSIWSHFLRPPNPTKKSANPSASDEKTPPSPHSPIVSYTRKNSQFEVDLRLPSKTSHSSSTGTMTLYSTIETLSYTM